MYRRGTRQKRMLAAVQAELCEHEKDVNGVLPSLYRLRCDCYKPCARNC